MLFAHIHFSVAQSFWNCAQSTEVILPCSVQKFKTMKPWNWILWTNEISWDLNFNSLAPGRCGCNLKLIILKPISKTFWAFPVKLPSSEATTLHWWLVSVDRHQAVTWSNVDQVLCCHLASVIHNVFNLSFRGQSCITTAPCVCDRHIAILFSLDLDAACHRVPLTAGLLKFFWSHWWITILGCLCSGGRFKNTYELLNRKSS